MKSKESRTAAVVGVAIRGVGHKGVGVGGGGGGRVTGLGVEREIQGPWKIGLRQDRA